MKKGKVHLKLFRFFIYLTGVAVITFFVSVNIREKKLEVFTFGKEVTTLQIPTRDSSYKITTTLFLNEEIGLKKDKLRVKISKTFPVTLRKKGSKITSEEELKRLIESKKSPNHPNGSLLSFKGDLYLVEGGELRKFSSKNMAERIGFDITKIKEITLEEFEKFGHHEDLISKKLKASEYPKNLIIKTPSNFYITGVDNISPISSKEVLDSAWKNFLYIESGGNIPEDMDDFDCYVINEKEISCDFYPKKIKNDKGTVYFIKATGLNKKIIRGISVEVQNSNNIQNLWNNFKQLAWKGRK